MPVTGTLVREPALSWITALSAAAAVVIRLVHVTPGQASYISVAAVAVGTVITAALARPVNVASISGASGALLAGLADFGLHLPPTQIATITAAVGLVVGLVVRGHLTPVANRPVQPAPVPGALHDS